MDDANESPVDPNMIIDSSEVSVVDGVAMIVDILAKRKLIAAG